MAQLDQCAEPRNRINHRKRDRCWYWRFRRNGTPVVVEQQDDGSWYVFIDTVEFGVAATRQAAHRLIEELDAETRTGSAP
jgi:hypothetical protein